MPPNVKRYFQLTQDEDDYPPVSVESVWAVPTEDPRQFVLDNVPFFVLNATLGDTVIASVRDGAYWFEKVVQHSGNSLIRVVFFDGVQRKRIAQELKRIGCSTEYLEAHALLAVNIPAGVPLALVQVYLQREAAAEYLDYEEPMLRQ